MSSIPCYISVLAFVFLFLFISAMIDLAKVLARNKLHLQIKHYSTPSRHAAHTQGPNNIGMFSFENTFENMFNIGSMII